MRHFLLIATALTLLFAAGLQANPSRTWTNHEGRTITARLVDIDGDTVTIQRDDGQQFTVAVSSFSEADQRYVTQRRQQMELPLEPARWPTTVQVRAPQVTIVEEQGSSFIYRTEHFEFRSNVRLSRTLVAEFGRIFEATFETVQELPLGLDLQPPSEGFFITELFGTVQDYFDAGGRPGAAGIYQRGTRRIMIPLENLGVRRSSSGFTFDRYADSGTLIHEITHQVMHDWLPRLPVWFVEGIAVYVQSVPYNNGTFNFQRHDPADQVRRRLGSRETDIPMVPLEKLFSMTFREWGEAVDARSATVNYVSGFLLTYFFFHMDGDRDALRVRQYLRAIGSGTPEAEARALLLDGRSAAELQNEFVRGFNRRRMSVRPLP